jgi:hypothetical protein
LLYELLTEPAFGASVPSVLIDEDSFSRFDEQLGAFAVVDRFFVGIVKTKVLAVLQRELALYDAAFVVGPNGYQVRRLTDTSPPGTTETELDDGDVASGFEEDFGEDRITDTILWNYDRAADGTVTPLTTSDWSAVAAHRGADRQEEYDSGSRSSLLVNYYLAWNKLERYRLSIHRASFTVGHDHLLLPGDVVLLSSDSDLVGRSGGQQAEGAQGCRAVVSGVNLSLARGNFGISAWRTDLHYDKQRRIAHALRLAGVFSSTILIVLPTTYISGSDPVGDWIEDRDAWQEGDVGDIVDIDGAVKVSGVVYQSENGVNGINVTGLGSYTWASGDTLVCTSWDNSSTRQRDTFAHIADTDGTIPSSSVDGAQYEPL